MAFLATGVEQVQEMVMVGVRREDGLPIVATLGDVKPIASGAKRGSRGTRKDPPLNSGFSSGKFSYIFFAETVVISYTS